MRLESLTLLGFKSFAERTVFDFSAGITVVIGPNGSGKSNVIDALRWCTGGGRASNFRAHEQQALIFHGAQGKRSVGYAEVELCFRKLETNTPYKTSSCSVQRSLYKDGSSKLLLQGQNARLRDVEEALAGSGLGRRGLAIIGQGEVGEVLMASPEHLLAYLEEAAGVATLRSRREQTLSRLDASREHSQRLQDLLLERQQQLAQLADDAAQAERAQQLQTQHNQLRYSIAAKRYLALYESYQQQAQRLQSQQQAQYDAQEQLTQEQQHYQQAQQALNSRLEQRAQARGEVQAKEAAWQLAQERQQHLVAEQQRLEQHISSLQEKLRSLDEAQPPQPPSGDLEAMEQQLAQLETQSHSQQQERQALEQRYQQAQQAYVQAQQRQQAAEQQQQSLQQLHAQLSSHSQRYDQCQHERQACQGRYEHAGKVLEAAVQAQQQAQETLAHVHQEHAHAAAEAMAQERAAARSQAALTARQGYAQGPRYILERQRPGVIGSVADLLEVPEAYQAAIASALGRRAEHIVVRRANNVPALLAEVRQQGGWVTLLPLDLLEPRQPRLDSDLARHPAVIGLASDLVNTASAYRLVRNHLLGNTVVLRSLEEALRLARESRQRPRMVTMQGDIIEVYGAISGGKRSQHSGVLGLRGDAERAQATAHEAQQLAQSLEQSLQQARQRLQTAQHALQQCQRVYQQQQSSLQSLREEEASLRSLQEAWQKQYESLQQQSPQPVDPQQLHSLEQAQQQLRQQQQQANEAQQQQQQQQADLRQAIALLRERQSHYQQALQRYQQEQDQRGVWQNQRVHSQQTLQENLEQQQTSIAACQQCQQELQRAQAALADDHLEQQQQQLTQQAAKLTQSQQQLQQLQQRYTEQNAALARCESQLEQAATVLEQFPDGMADTYDGSVSSAEKKLRDVDSELRSIGAVNHRASLDYAQQKQALEHLQAQNHEAERAADALQQLVQQLDAESDRRLRQQATQLQSRFTDVAHALFGEGTQAQITLLEQQGRLQGLRIQLQPPGKHTRSLNLLSVGERTMGALAFLFALMKLEQQDEANQQQGLPLAILDEVDAPLDEANIRRFCDFTLRLAAQGTQFILVTHQKATMDIADTLWGVSSEAGISRVFSIAKDEAAKNEAASVVAAASTESV